MLTTAVLLAMTMGAAQADDPKRGKRLIWHDEFAKDGAPDPGRWDYEVGKVRNQERQYYTRDRRQNARIENGELVIEARKEAYEGADVTSASLMSVPSWTYGYFEVRAKIPTGKGTWPAIWMLGDGIRQKGDAFVGWPLCGEIDIMENVGFDPDRVHFNIHTQTPGTAEGSTSSSNFTVAQLPNDFHVYGLDWNKDRMNFYFDGKKVMTYINDGKGKGAWPFDAPQYLILNLAIGGNWGGQQGVDDAIFPSRYLVDYVRVYR